MDVSYGRIDLVLEQIINSNAASQHTGISSITNSIPARQRWAASHSLQTKSILMLFEKLGFTKKDDITRDLKPNQNEKNTYNMVKIITNCVKYRNFT